MKKKYTSVTVSKEWIEDNIQKPGWQRNLYPSRVNSFVNHIKEGTFKKSLVTVAKEKDKFILLDGQHKLEAIRKSNAEISMDFLVYEDINEEEMMNVYKILNDVKQPRLIDDLKTYLGRIEWLDAFLDEKNFPINVSLNGGVNSLRIDRFLNIISNGLVDGMVRKNLARKSLPIFIESLDAEVYSLTKDFCKLYKKCFGEPFNENFMYKNPVMFTLFRVWRHNNDLSEEQLIKCFKQVEMSARVRQESFSTHKEGIEVLTRAVYSALNKGRSATKFKIFWEEYFNI